MSERTNLDQQTLIARCIKNDRMAQKQLFLQFRDALYATSLKYCRNTEEAQDNVHDTFVVIFETIHKYRGTGNFVGWMQRITINQAVKKFKTKIRFDLREEMYVPQDFEILPTALEVPLDDILQAIQKLPSQYRLVFSLYVLDEYSHKEIASLLGISEGTSKSNLHRAKALLKSRLAPSEKPNNMQSLSQ
ncbi:MAG: RNA polymerase sigma factor [Gilvibacter sp.]